MYEVELKVSADLDRVATALQDRGADRVDAVVQVDTYYDAPHREFAETDEALRIRRETPVGGNGESGDGENDANDTGEVNDTDHPEPTAKVTYKGPLVERASKTREEFETAVADGEAMAAVLDGLGFEPAATVEKERRRYRLAGYTVTLDRVSEVGEYVEVEAAAAEADVETVREGAAALLSDLGLDPDEQVRTSYLGLQLGDSQ
ncbi:MAG: class IV adenylate cyclase [Halolamina sp.]